MKCQIKKELQPMFPDPDLMFDLLSKLDGTIYREVESRRTFRFEFAGANYFAKLHFGVGWREIFKNLFQFRLPILGAKNEWQAILHLANHDVEVPAVVAIYSRGLNPATIQSVIVTKELTSSLSVEDLCRKGLVVGNLKRLLIKKIAMTTRQMHRCGVNHRDCYICHFHVNLDKYADTAAIKVFVIDLHRAQLRSRTPMRWRVKDVGSLLFSALEENAISDRDILKFMRHYSQKSLKETLREDRSFWQNVRIRARRLYLENHSQLHPLLQ